MKKTKNKSWSFKNVDWIPFAISMVKIFYHTNPHPIIVQQLKFHPKGRKKIEKKSLIVKKCQLNFNHHLDGQDLTIKKWLLDFCHHGNSQNIWSQSSDLNPIMKRFIGEINIIIIIIINLSIIKFSHIVKKNILILILGTFKLWSNYEKTKKYHKEVFILAPINK